jgi:hypothetical protein
MGELTSARNGTYQGECLVHCNEEVTVSPGELRYDLTSPAPDPANPDIHASEPLTPERWAAVVDAAERSAVDRLPARIGMPDAYDAGGEFLELVRDDEVKRVDLDQGTELPDAAPLLALLRELRGELASRHRP